MIENTNTKQFYPGPILNNTLEITDFLFNDAEQIKIKHSKLNEEGILIDVDLNYPTDYEVTKVLPSDINAAEAALTASTGQIMLKNVNVLAGEKLTVYRVSQIIQDKDYPRTGAFPAATHEGALDYLTMQNQEQKDEIDRALKVPVSTEGFNGSLPVPIPARALKINNDGTGFEMSEFDPDLALVTTEEFKNQSQQAAAEALASQNIATEQANIATQQAGIATEKTTEVAQAKEEAITTIKDAETNSVTKINSEFNKANEWFEKLNALPYIPVGTILPTTGAIDESLGYQRYANGQLIANVSSQAPDLVKFLEFQEAHAPNLLCSETAWQTALTLSTLGQVGKYVWNKEEDSVRIPRIVNIQGMMDMNTVGNMVEAGLPDHTHTYIDYFAAFSQGHGGEYPLVSSGNTSDTKTTKAASLSNSIYGKSNTVQEESILYPYVLQIATGVQYKTPVQNELERIVPYSFGNHKYSNVLLNNPAWMRSVGQWNSAKTHGDYYNWLVEERRNPKDIPARANVTKIGHIIDNDGVLSGFSENDYVITPIINFSNANSWEIYTQKFSLSSLQSTETILFNNTSTDGADGIAIFIRANGTTSWSVQSVLGTNIFKQDANTNIQINTEYQFKLEFTGSVYNFYLSTNGGSFVLVDTYTSSTKANLNISLAIGRGIRQYWTGNPIDLNESYINIDGQRWWSGIKSKVRLHTEDYGPEDWVINQSEQTFRLPLVADRVLVDKVEGLGWYNFYNDGFLEQGNRTYIAGTGTTQVSLIKAFRDTNYLVCLESNYVDSTSANQTSSKTAVSVMTNTSFRVGAETSRNYGWQAIGYAEIPTEEQRTMNKYLYFYVGGVAKNEHLVDVGRIEEKLVDKANKSDVDGQWEIVKAKNLASNVSFPINTTGSGTPYIYDVSDLLPNDGFDYEIQVSLECNNSAWVIGYYFYPDTGNTVTFVKGGNPCGGAVLGLVNSSRTLKISIVATQAGAFWLNIDAYRRIGKNV